MQLLLVPHGHICPSFSSPELSSQEIKASGNPNGWKGCGSVCGVWKSLGWEYALRWEWGAHAERSFGNLVSNLADLGALYAWSQGSSGLDSPHGQTRGSSLWLRCCCISVWRTAEPLLRRQIGTVLHGAHVLPKLPFGRGWQAPSHSREDHQSCSHLLDWIKLCTTLALGIPKKGWLSPHSCQHGLCKRLPLFISKALSLRPLQDSFIWWKPAMVKRKC